MSMPDAENRVLSLGVNFPVRKYGQHFGCTIQGIRESPMSVRIK